jgi:rhodanese-related sulfurtransferase
VIAVHDAVELHGGDVVFVDVRESDERAKGTIPDSIHAPRGFLEFIADPAGPMHNPAFASGKKLVLFCGTGGRSAMAAKTLVDMGFGDVISMAGGFQAWTQAGGAVAR